MRWLLLLVVMGTSVGMSAQSTLKIFVTNDDDRSDMAIIDLNTSSINRYGKSVDSTNIQFYTVTMSTQVVRMSYLELYGEEEYPVVPLAEVITKTVGPTNLTALDEPVASIDQIPERNQRSNLSKETQGSTSNLERQSSTSKTVSIQRSSKEIGSTSRRKTTSLVRKKSNRKVKRPKGKRAGKYKGKCPKFY